MPKTAAERLRYSRDDLDMLTTLDRAAVLDVLGSFDERGLSECEFILAAGGLLDPERVPGLADALERAEAEAVLQATYEACREAACELNGESAPVDKTSQRQPQVPLAEEVLQHRFTFYGEQHRLPEDIDWDYNPGTGHWAQDLNRFSYINTLVRAWRESGDERFSGKAVELILDWIDKCDIGRAFIGTPHVWGSYLNNAIHCEIWAAALQRLIPSDQLKPLELLRILKSLHDQLAYLEIVTNRHHGNWPTIGCRGMLSTLAALPVFRDTDRFVEYGVDTIAVQIDEQVLPDGVQDELTPHYHWVVVRNLQVALKSARALGCSFPDRTLDALRKMIHYQQQMITPNGGALVAFNDSDPEIVPGLEKLLADVGLEEFLSPPERLGAELFPFAGVALLRQRQDQGDLYLAFDAGPFGRGHQHEDKLGFWLFAYGRSFIVDPGRHLYDRSAVSFRPHLQSTGAHSTIRVDDCDQHSRGRPDTWIADRPTGVQWARLGRRLHAAGCYDLGYGEANEIGVVHRREIVFVDERFWVIFDLVVGEGAHEVESRFQFGPGSVTLTGGRAVTDFDEANLLVWTQSPAGPPDAHVEKGRKEPTGGWYSPSYGRIEPAPCLVLNWQARLPMRAATLLLPFRGSRQPDVRFELTGPDRIVVEAPDLERCEVRSELLPEP